MGSCLSSYRLSWRGPNLCRLSILRRRFFDIVLCLFVTRWVVSASIILMWRTRMKQIEYILYSLLRNLKREMHPSLSLRDGTFYYPVQYWICSKLYIRIEFQFMPQRKYLTPPLQKSTVNAARRKSLLSVRTKNALCGHNAELYYAKAGGTYRTTKV
jgi:hypothetical protein